MTHADSEIFEEEEEALDNFTQKMCFKQMKDEYVHSYSHSGFRCIEAHRTRGP